MSSDMLQATAPDVNVWVSAHAGTGKTHILTQRVLRLLVEGVAPSSILCLTYTKAAAAEMRARITEAVGRFAVESDAGVATRLEPLLGRKPNAKTITHARTLFGTLVDLDDAPRIETLHAFCHMVLKKFPLEAGIFPQFALMDEVEASQLKHEAIRQVLKTHALGPLATRYSDGGVFALATAVLAHEHAFRAVLEKGNATAHMRTLIGGGGEYFNYTAAEIEQLQAARAALATSKAATDNELAEALGNWLSERNADRYASAWLTREGEISQRLFTKAIEEPHRSILEAEAQRALAYTHAKNEAQAAALNEALYAFAVPLIAKYRELKDARAALDFDDVIAYTKRLLTAPDMLPWVLYRMDATIDHFMIDEAQDTSPDQWAIVHALTEDIFAGESAKTRARSLFVVGDFKQSIYSFQGADVAQFDIANARLKQKTEAARLPFVELILNQSYRSTAPVLQAVDAICNPKTDDEKHHCKRVGQAGRVELWPLISADEEDSSEEKATTFIIEKIAGWLKEKRYLEAKGRDIRPSDIMILLRSRGTFAARLTNAFKRLHIPVSGPDRMLLREHIAVEDVLALLQFLNLPDDDYSLACALKSPLFNLSEEALFALAHGREGRLLDALKPKQPAIYERLSVLLSRVDFATPFHLISQVLSDEVRGNCVARLGVEVLDALDALLRAALEYEAHNTPSLQGFLEWMATSDVLLTGNAPTNDAIRIMTVHAAKGLQAPIVIVAGAASAPSVEDAIFWHQDLPLLLPPAARSSPKLKDIKAGSKQEDLEEYMRLLYVALTRAEDELYITGHGKNPRLHSWFKLMEAALNSPTLTAPQTAPPQERRSALVLEVEVPRPEFSTSLKPREVIEPITPSHAVEESRSPLDVTSAGEFGSMVHLLLQHRTASPTVLARAFPGADPSAATAHVQTLLMNESLAWLWKDGLREVPISGVVEWEGRPRLVSGQVDALFIDETECKIVDYKTNPNPPREIPRVYQTQLALYAAVLQKAYPHKKIRKFILWTATGELVEL